MKSIYNTIIFIRRLNKLISFKSLFSLLFLLGFWSSTLGQVYKINGDTVLQKPNTKTLIIGDKEDKHWGFGTPPNHPSSIIEFPNSITRARLAEGGVWVNNSDGDSKEDHQVLYNILDSLRELNITSWRYIGHNDRHIGPISSDFSSLFNIGNDTTVATTDPAGVALAAIKELDSIVFEAWQLNVDTVHTDKKVGIGVQNTGQYELYVNGDAYATEIWSSSDKRFKKNIKTLEKPLEKIKAMRGTSFEFRTNGFEEKHFTNGKKLGFMAQELLEVMPELVRKDHTGHYAVQYQGIIPLLVEGMKEQQAMIEQQQELIQQQSEAIEAIKLELAQSSLATSQAARFGNNSLELEQDNEPKLYQNFPNPFYKETVIKYFIPVKAKQATLFIHTMNGLQVRELALEGRGIGQVNIEAGEFKAGIYLYTLVIDGQSIGSKKMILTQK